VHYPYDVSESEAASTRADLDALKALQEDGLSSMHGGAAEAMDETLG